ncbi:aminotransferase class V-fold PLP-dependent enzyme [Odoribacter sp. OttesenSCG-928-L07]|nr:aminotransferase class V-fold PLP-dependent enzyme [Odoribacter sp. OttesenSCG-928-L07]MDL2238934.1 aminotransferase class V-fold PLP-dependent enzyme [Bacteroidales bacterium OttesenSCG-928-L14]
MAKLIYFDNGATTFPKPQEVYDFMHNFYMTHGVNPGRSGYDAVLETEEVMFGTRRMLTEMFNGGNDPNRLTFSYNASDSLNMIIQGICEKGDHVITSVVEHNSVLRPLYVMEQQGIIEVTYIGVDEFGYVNPDDFKKALKPNTKMIIMNHCSNVFGTVQPIAEVGKIAKEAGVIMAVDASQSAGILPIDMQAMNLDVVVFTGHKCLMGPTGIGGSYVREGVPVRTTKYGGTGVRSAVRTHLDEFPYRLECGTINIVGVAGLYAGQKWIREKGMENIHNHEMKLWQKLVDGMKNIDKVQMYCCSDPSRHNAVLSFNIDGWEAGDIGTLLDVDYNIACRTGLQCAPLIHEAMGTAAKHGTVRFSLGAFNTEEEVNIALEAVEDIASIPR